MNQSALRALLQSTYARVDADADKLDELEQSRRHAHRPAAGPAEPSSLLSDAGLTPRVFNLLAQGDSWFEYGPLWCDVIDYLEADHGHQILNLAASGSTINEIAYGKLPIEDARSRGSGEIDRVDELVYQLRKQRPQALLLSAGGTDIGGDPFGSFLHNALSDTPGLNHAVVDGVLRQVIGSAYRRLIDLALAVADDAGFPLKVFVQGYDYQWPDGRGAKILFLRITGPWYHGAFTSKNYPYADEDPAQLARRRALLAQIQDAFAEMLAEVAADYGERVVQVDFRGTLPHQDQWANEVHPTDEGFRLIADKLNLELHRHLG